MIDIFEVLDWLNAIDNQSDLSSATCSLIQSARVIGRSDASVMAILDRLQQDSRASIDAREKAEIMLNVSAIEHWRGWSPDAVRHAKEAVNGYKNDDHRRAIARWILGMALWESFQNDLAYRNWRSAKKLINTRRKFFIRFPYERNWYEEKCRRIEIDLAGKPEEILTWLNLVEGSALTSPSRQLVNAAQEYIRQRKYRDVNAIVGDLQEISTLSRELYERAEVFFECGFFAYQMGNLRYAVELLKKAMAEFSPGKGGSHKQVVARCMLGAMEWMDESRHNQALTDWRRCIEDLDTLRLQADKDNRQSRKKWYADHRDILQAALAERLPHTQPPRERPNAAPARSPKPTTHQPIGSEAQETSVAEKKSQVNGAPEEEPDTKEGFQESPVHLPTAQQHVSERYQDLVVMIGGDRPVADRLIEYERKRFPHESLDKLIERAIQRLLDDRR
ncbi:MAG TPA: hypothetical protein VK909_10555 [Anaerolineales bacterium]|nr:hypothetical protein [Anaerolineales bacterium]